MTSVVRCPRLLGMSLFVVCAMLAFHVWTNSQRQSFSSKKTTKRTKAEPVGVVRPHYYEEDSEPRVKSSTPAISSSRKMTLTTTEPAGVGPPSHDDGDIGSRVISPTPRFSFRGKTTSTTTEPASVVGRPPHDEDSGPRMVSPTQSPWSSGTTTPPAGAGRRPSDGVWFNFSAPPALYFFAYSAFVDERTPPSAAAGAKVVRVMGVSTKSEELTQRNISLLCVCNYADGRPAGVFKLLTDPTAIGMGYPLYGISVREYIHACPLAYGDAWPVSLLITTNTSRLENSTRSAAMPVEVARKYDVKQPLAVCVQAAFRRLDPVRLVEWLEFQRLVGVTMIGVYVLSDLSPTARKLFRYYADVEHLVELRRTDYIERVVGGSETSADQYWLHLTPVINDCLYRNMYRFNRIGVMDFDEVIVPRRNWTRLVEMVDELHRNYSASGYVFRNNYFFLDLPSDKNDTSNVTFVQYRFKTVVSPPGYSVKTIIDPTTCVGMHNHYCWGFVDGIKKHHHDVDPDVGMLQHYKRCHFSTDECRQMMKDIRSDNTMLKYRQKLSRVVSQKLTSFYRWSSQR